MQFLKFPNEAEFLTAIAPFCQPDQSGDLQIPSYIGTSAVDVIGVIHKPTGEFAQDAEGFTCPVMAPLDGWHVNLSGDCPEELQAFVVAAPKTPSRVFA